MNHPVSDQHAGVIVAQDITLKYGSAKGVAQPVLGGFSMHVRAGEVVAVLGPSGVGKSSLLRVLAGLQQADAGQVAVHGQVMRKPHPRVGTVFQNACLLPWLTLEQNVGFGLDFGRQPSLDPATRRERIDRAIEEVDLLHARRHFPAQLSGGMAQRTALARCLARQPQVLLLDEPFSALDAITRHQMQQLLQQIITRHRTAAVLVTHDLDEALMLADRIILIGGRPAGLAGEWTMRPARFDRHPPDATLPRGESLASLSEVRAEIVQIMRQARHDASSLSQRIPEPA